MSLVRMASEACGLALVVVAFGSSVGCVQRGGPSRVAADCFPRGFTAEDVGRLPAGWTPLVTNGRAANTDWQVIADAAAPGERCLALVRNANGRGQLNLCVRNDPLLTDVDLSACCKGDFGVGIVWRCRDADNYYVCRVNPAEGNFNLYKVVDKKRTKLATARLRRFIDEQWYELRVVVSGDEVSCYLDGRVLITARDESIPGPGRIGVWTRADALGSFARIEIGADSAPPRGKK